VKGGAETEDTPYIEMADVAVMPLDVQVVEAYARCVAQRLLPPKALCCVLNLYAVLTKGLCYC
jgi:hypothetical protein